MEKLSHREFLLRYEAALKQLEPALKKELFAILKEGDRRMTTGFNDLQKKAKGKTGMSHAKLSKTEIMNKYLNKS